MVYRGMGKTAKRTIKHSFAKRILPHKWQWVITAGIKCLWFSILGINAVMYYLFKYVPQK